MRLACLTLLVLSACESSAPTPAPAAEPPPVPPALAEAAEAAELADDEAMSIAQAPASFTVPSDPAERARAYEAALALARAARRSGDTDAAIASYRQAAALDESGRTRCELGWVLFQADQKEEGARAIREAAERLPRHPVPRELRGAVGACLYNLGRVEEDEGDTEKARFAYERSLVVRPGNRVVRSRLRDLPPAPRPAVPVDVSCGSGAPLDLDAWVEQLRAATDADGFDRAVAAVGQDPISVPVDEYADGDLLPDTRIRGEVREVPLRLGLSRGRVVQLRTMDGRGNETVWAFVFRMDEGRPPCLVDVLAAHADECTAGRSRDPLFAFTTLPLANEGVDALRVVEHSGQSCGRFQTVESAVSFYFVGATELREVLTVVTHSASYEEFRHPVASTYEDYAEVTVSGEGFPRRLRVRERRVCSCTAEEVARLEAAIDEAEGEDAEEDAIAALEGRCGVLDEPCEPRDEARVFVLRDGTYVEDR
ncbi:MAG: tetratricopeptide repeat protein [Myxococcota bacterium]